MNNNTLEENQKIIDDYINKNKKSYDIKDTNATCRVLTKEQKAIEMLRDRLFALEDKVLELERSVKYLKTGYYSNVDHQENDMSRKSLIKAIDDFYESATREIMGV